MTLAAVTSAGAGAPLLSTDTHALSDPLSPSHTLPLPRDRIAPATARDWVSRRFGADLDEERLAVTTLLVGELVTNAFLHGQGTIVLRARLDPDQLFAEVIDEGHGFAWTRPARDLNRANGWGLIVLDSIAERWGIEQGTTHVWFELDL
ncbi:MAG: ATP-binding protein [Solirubrobacteraceae bacterium]